MRFSTLPVSGSLQQLPEQKFTPKRLEKKSKSQGWEAPSVSAGCDPQRFQITRGAHRKLQLYGGGVLEPAPPFKQFANEQQSNLHLQAQQTGKYARVAGPHPHIRYSSDAFPQTQHSLGRDRCLVECGSWGGWASCWLACGEVKIPKWSQPPPEHTISDLPMTPHCGWVGWGVRNLCHLCGWVEGYEPLAPSGGTTLTSPPFWGTYF